jgi:tRNA(Leu) C34 or U34 (ribose-2'-O)-methylase TrmL
MTSQGITPAVLLIDPKKAGNVGKALRTCACLGVAQLWYTGNRAEAEWRAMSRLPREERMPRYTTQLLPADPYRWLEEFPPGTEPVAVEISRTAQDLAWFEHPENALYVFGPEDGSLEEEQHTGIRAVCRQFVTLPADGCLNLAAAVAWTLGDRRTKLIQAGLAEPKPVWQRVRAIQLTITRTGDST